MKQVAFLVMMALYSAHAQNPLQISTEFKRTKSAVGIVFTAVANREIVMPLAELPWFLPSDFTFIVIPVGSGVGIRRVYIPQSLLVGDFTFKKGVPSKNSLLLLNYFPDLVGENAKSDLIFFWHWRCSMPKDKKIDDSEYGGWVRIPKNAITNSQP